MNSDKIVRCIVNLSGHAINYAPERWAYVPLITDLSAKYAAHTEGAASVYYKIKNIIKNHNPDCLVGRYVSWRVQDEFIQFPQECLERSLFDVNEIVRENRPNIDDQAILGKTINLLNNECHGRDADFYFLDNNVHPSALSTWFSWESTIRFFRAFNLNNKKLIANIAGAPWVFPDKDIEYLTHAVAGAAFEMPFHTNARASRETIKRSIDVYRYMLDAGLIVCLLGVGDSYDVDGKMLGAYATILRRPGDKLFVAWPFWKPSPVWERLPEQLGAPIDEYYITKDLKIIRAFERGVLTLNVPLKDYTLDLY